MITNKAEKLKKHWDIQLLVKRFLTVSELSQTYAFACCQFDLMSNVCVHFASVMWRNLAPGGKAFQSDQRPWINATKAIDNADTPKFTTHTCTRTQNRPKSWWRVDFNKLVEVYAVKVMPGKLISTVM